MALRQTLKHQAGRLLFASGAYRRFFRDRAVIVLFHRVDDRYPDNPISCDSRKFDRFCTFFDRYFDVVPLTELLDRMETGEDVGGRLAITFDDGYRDNHDVAAGILRDHRLPATFFIATGFIGTRRVPWWDEENGIVSEWMTWEEVEALAREFHVGPHTVNHVDLGKVEGPEAEEEILMSREHLDQRLGDRHDLFSYPYGRRNQMSEGNRELVRRNGFRCCLSAYGGSVRPGDDLFRLKRVPIGGWFRTPEQFGLEVALDRA